MGKRWITKSEEKEKGKTIAENDTGGFYGKT
jgi:hypothetical protein